MFITELARKNWETKYQYNNETPLETQKRIAKAVASVEKNPEEWEDKFLKVLVKFNENGEPIGLKNTFGGRITANIGTHYEGTTLLNCFVSGPVNNAQIKYERNIPNTDMKIPIEINTQSTPDNLSNIMLTLLEQAETLKSEGGYGINFGFIRPRGTLIKSIGIKHPGVVHYMRIWDTVASVIVMGDTDGYKDEVKNYLEDISPEVIKGMKKQARKGAQMAALQVSHPDIEEFIKAKQEKGKLTKFNMSILIDDAFIHAVIDDLYYDLHFDGKVYKRVKARELYDIIVKSSHNRNEPGVLFYDNIQKNNPLSYLGELNASNPCGEVAGNPSTSTVCLLGSVNLTQYVNIDRTFDFELYKHDVELFARMLDNVNDLATASLSQYTWAIKNIRQYGMGINGLGSALYMMGISYREKEAIDFVDKITSLKEEITWRTSAFLAKEKGTFPAYNYKFLETNWFTNFTKISQETKELIKKYGVRNGKTSCNPPSGNTSIICDNVSNGIEPVFSQRYMRTYIIGEWPDGLNKYNVKKYLSEIEQGDSIIWDGYYNKKHYVYEPHNRGLCAIEEVMDYGYAWVRDHYPDDIKNNASYLVSASTLSIDEHIKIQETVQKNCNQAVSKTINLPENFSIEDYKDLFIKAWSCGLNGITTYRDGSMESVLSVVQKNNGSREIIRKDIKLPDVFINGPMNVVKREGMKFYMNFSYLPEDGELIFPVAMWIHTNSFGEIREGNAAVKALINLLEKFEILPELIENQKEKIRGNPGHQRVAKMISMCLRHNIPIVNIVHVLDQIEDVYVTDTIYAVKKFLSENIEEGTPVIGAKCTACKSSNVVYTGGCSLCMDCGASGCE